MNCVQVVRDDFDAVLKAIFRVRGETARIDIADALGRHFYDDRGLATEFGMAVGAVRHCLKIRNQYATTPASSPSSTWKKLPKIIRNSRT